MSKVKRPWGTWAFCLFTIACGLGCHAIVMATNWKQGATIGQDEWAQSISAYGALAIDFGGIVVCSALLGFYRRAGRWALATWLNVPILACIGYSLVMFDGFGATNRIEPSRRALAQHEANLTAHQQSVMASSQARNQIVDILKGELNDAVAASLKKGLTVDQRSSASIQSQSFRQSLAGFTDIEVKAPPVAADTDPQATRLAKHVGWGRDSMQEALSVIQGALLLLVSSLLIRHGVQNWPQRDFRPIIAPTNRPKLLGKPKLTLVPKGLTKSELDTLEVLRQHQAYPLKNVEVATLLEVSQGEANRRVAKLVKKGLVEKIKCGREVQITLIVPGRIPTPPRKFGDYFKINQSRESTVKLQTDNVVSMTG